MRSNLGGIQTKTVPRNNLARFRFLISVASTQAAGLTRKDSDEKDSPVSGSAGAVCDAGEVEHRYGARYGGSDIRRGYRRAGSKPAGALVCLPVMVGVVVETLPLLITNTPRLEIRWRGLKFTKKLMNWSRFKNPDSGAARHSAADSGWRNPLKDLQTNVENQQPKIK